MTAPIEEKLRQIKLVALDVDGVLTDGNINIGERGEIYKAFSAKDGLSISAAIRHGLKVVIVTGRVSSIVHNRARELNLTPSQSQTTSLSIRTIRGGFSGPGRRFPASVERRRFP